MPDGRMSTTKLPYTEPEWKIPGYTGYVEGLKETFKKTPILCQKECRTPEEGSFILQRTQRVGDGLSAHVETVRKAQPENLWPNLQSAATRDPFRPPKSNVSLGQSDPQSPTTHRVRRLGDRRINAFQTSYDLDFGAPFEESKCIRSPMRNYDLAKSGSSLKNHYAASYNRVGQERLLKMLTRMRERLEAKLGNSNDNAFKLRKLFKRYDRENAGLIPLEDFRMMTESFGMQLDDDSLLALYHVYDPDATGSLKYERLMLQLLDPDYFSLYTGKSSADET